MVSIYSEIDQVLVEDVFYHSNKNMNEAKKMLEMLRPSSSIAPVKQKQPDDEDEEMKRILKESEEQFKLDQQKNAQPKA